MKLRRNKHNLSHFRHTSFDMGKLTPIACYPTIRGDTIKQKTSLLLRTSPLVYPIMHPVHSYVAHYAVPIRLIWEEWTDFITGGEDFDAEPTFPTIDFSGSPVAAGDLANHLGYPVGFAGTASALEFRAFALIYNERIRDDQLQAKVGLDITSGADTTTNTDNLNANWNADMYVKARPDEQLGTEVSLALTGNAFVKTDVDPSTSNHVTVKYSSGNHILQTKNANTDVTVANSTTPNGTANPLKVDGSTFNPVSINALRLAIATQQWQEYINSSGNEYHDYLDRYGIKYSDARINRPEFLGSSKKTLQFSEVLQTAPDIDATSSEGVASLKGHGIAAMRSNEFMRFFEEDCIIISVLSVKPIPMYMENVPRHFMKRTKEEFYQKEFELIGWQDIPYGEVQYDHSTPEGTFGYQPRYEEYRGIPNTVHGEFATTLKNRHMARFFDGNDVALNSAFITCNPTDRIYADSTEDHIKATVENKIMARRIVSSVHKPSGLTIS